MAGIGFGTNYDVKANAQGIGGRTLIVSVIGTDTANDVSQVELDAVVQAITTQRAPGAGVAAADAFTVVGVSGTVGDGTMYLALQGTGTVGTDAGDYADGVTVGGTIIEFNDDATNGGVDVS